MSGSPSGAETVIESIDDLVDHIRTGEKSRELWKVGTEHEKIGLYRKDLSRVSYEGDDGIRGLLEEISESDGWSRTYESDEILVALEKDGASITLEPGGQLELSGAPLRTIHETCSEFHRHLEVIRSPSEARDIVWLSLGIDPCHSVREVPKVPKQRYGVMRDYLPAKGTLPLEMMHLTSTVQANFDFSDENDMAKKMRTATAVSPIVSAIFANSSIAGGQDSGFISKRVDIWQNTDRDRCGLLPFVFEDDFGYRDYVEWALDVPMFFRFSGGSYRRMNGASFRSLLDGLPNESPATLMDFELHLTTLFPEVRLKRFIEVRGADAVPPGLLCALPALWKGILYDRDSLDAAWDLVSSWSFAERLVALDQVARLGLEAAVEGRPVLELAKDLVEISAAGLGNLGVEQCINPDETSYLEPIRRVLEMGKSPGQIVMEKWINSWSGSFERLVDFSKF